MNNGSLTESEWRIMQLLWEDSPLTCRQMEDKLKDETGWSRNTLFTFLRRMTAKKAIRREDATPSYLYYPLLDKKEAIQSETRMIVDRLHGGKLGMLVNTFISYENTSESEIDELLTALQNAKKEREK